MKAAPVLIAALAAAALLSVGVVATGLKGSRSCPQGLAAYGALDQAILLEFAGTADGRFEVLLGDGGVALEGFVYPGEDDGGKEAVVLNNCPEGDATGEELAACTIWQGPINAVADGSAGPLPASDQPAAGALRLAGFDEALTASEFYRRTGLPVRAFDELTLLACRQ